MKRTGQSAAGTLRILLILIVAMAALTYFRIAALPFLAAIPGKVMTMAVAVVLAIELVVFVPITDQIAQGKTIVRGDEIDAGLRCPSAVLKYLA